MVSVVASDHTESSTLFLLGTIVLLACSIRWGIRGFQQHSEPEIWLALIGFGFTGELGYETWSWWTGRDPTISHLAHFAYLRYAVIYLIIFCGLMFLIGVLSQHFTMEKGQINWGLLLGATILYWSGTVLVWWVQWKA
jgi:predicted permease